jgi:NAD(P) transhydrogenase subunit alpha
MKIAIPAERDAGEPRVAATPETVKKLIGLGADVAVARGAAARCGIADADYEAAGAVLAAGAAEAVAGADIVLKVRRPAPEELGDYPRGSAVVAIMDPFGHADALEALAQAGVAGLQAIATARRLGAIVTATDVRPAAKEQVESLGAKFVAVEDEEFKQAETAGGYAKEMSREYQAKQAALVADHIRKQDIVITTALIPGRPAPRLISSDMVASMRPGSVIVDLAAERGGNVEGMQPDAVADVNGVKILGYRNVPGRLAATASSLYARNLYAFVETLIDKDTKALAIDWDDEIVKATALTRDGAIVHPNFQPRTAA